MASDAALQNSPDVSTLSGSIERLIHRTGRLLRSTWVATGAALAVGLFFTTLVAIALFDLMLPLWPAFRFAALLLVAVPTIAIIIIG